MMFFRFSQKNKAQFSPPKKNLFRQSKSTGRSDKISLVWVRAESLKELESHGSGHITRWAGLCLLHLLLQQMALIYFLPRITTTQFHSVQDLLRLKHEVQIRQRSRCSFYFELKRNFWTHKFDVSISCFVFVFWGVGGAGTNSEWLWM